MKTTSFETVAQPKTGGRQRRSQSRAAGRRVERDEPARPLWSSRHRRTRAASCRGCESGKQRSTTGTKTRPRASAIGVSTPPSRPGQTGTGSSGSGPVSFRRRPTRVSHTRARVSRSQAITRPALPGADHERAAARAREDRRQLEVVVADVVRRHLVVPAPSSRCARSSTTQRVRVQHGARVGAAVRARRRPAPRDTGWRSPSRRCPRRRPSASARRRRRGPRGSATGPRIVSNRQRTSARRGVERDEDAAAARAPGPSCS